MHIEDRSSKITKKVNLAAGMEDDFRALLRRNPLRGRELDLQLTAALRDVGFRLDGQHLRALLAPVLISPTEVRELTRSVRLLSGLLEQVIELALGSVSFMEQVGVGPNIEEMALNDTPSRLGVEFGRYDFIPTSGGPRFIEFNVDSPAGAAFSSLLDAQFAATEPARECGMHSLFPSAPTVDLVVDTLLASYREHAKAVAEKPNVAVVDFDSTPTLPEQQLIVDNLVKRGHTAVLADPREFVFNTEDKGLYYKGTRFHLICRRALVPELARRRVLIGPFLHGLRYGDLVCINPLRSRLAGNKGVLEILTSTAFDRFFTPAENEAKARLLPWTRKLVERKTDYLGREIDLLPFVASRPERFVLKPGGAFGGQGVVLGQFCDPNEWLRRLDEAVNQGGVVQEYVPVREHKVPLLEGAEMVEQKKYLTLGAFAIRGEYAGCIGRVSEDPVVSVRRGGGIVPVLEVGGRSKTGPIEASRPKRRRTTGRAT